MNSRVAYLKECILFTLDRFKSNNLTLFTSGKPVRLEELIRNALNGDVILVAELVSLVALECDDGARFDLLSRGVVCHKSVL